MTREDLKQFDLPDHPGVYFFRDARRRILYIGKAASLRNRVRSYFSSDLIEGRGPRIVSMVEKAHSVTWQETNNVLEALILEASLIKKHAPPYNVDEKDNKSFNYLVITKESPPAGGFPQILIVRGRELFGPEGQKYKIKHLFGPFPQGGALREALAIVRRIFPFRDAKCVPCDEQRKKKNFTHCRPCFNRQIGLCPGVCTGDIGVKEYAEVVRHIALLFSGNFQGLKRTLEKEMKQAAKQEEFEKASALRRQIEALKHVRDVSLIKDEFRFTDGGGASARIESYDVAHTGGSETVGVMTVVAGGEPLRAAYRKFTIRSATNDDTASLREMLSRRLTHPEWPLPKVFVVDGGTGQMNAARTILKERGIEIPIVGVVKDEHHRPRELRGDQRAVASYEKDILLANAESHRFAITWHRRRMRRGRE